MQLSPLYLEKIQAAEQIAEQRGRQEGEMIGEARMIMRLLNRRLGSVPTGVSAQIQVHNCKPSWTRARSRPDLVPRPPRPGHIPLPDASEIFLKPSNFLPIAGPEDRRFCRRWLSPAGRLDLPVEGTTGSAIPPGERTTNPIVPFGFPESSGTGRPQTKTNEVANDARTNSKSIDVLRGLAEPTKERS